MVMNRGGQIVNKDYEEDIIEVIENMSEINVERVSRLNQNYDLIELSGVNSLCMNARKERVPLFFAVTFPFFTVATLLLTDTTFAVMTRK